MSKPSAVVWNTPPKFSLYDDPAIITDSHDLWLGYLLQESPDDNTYAIIHFQDVVDHRLSPINDEGFGQHKYATAGLKVYEFQEIVNSEEALRWKTLQVRHWVVTFKDQTLDVLARDCQVAVRSVAATSPLAAVLGHLANRLTEH